MHKSVVSSLTWVYPPEELHKTQADSIERLGHQHHFFQYDEPIPPGTDIVLVQGPYGSLLPLVRQLLTFPAESRPVLVYWFQQSLSLPRPQWACEMFARAFSELHRQTGWGERAFEHLMPRRISSKGKRFGFLGDILWLHRYNLLDVLALSSTYYADLLARQGIASTVLPRGFHPSYGSALDQPRDIAAVWMGKIRTRRRARALEWIEKELHRRNLVMQIYDGERNDFIFGQKRKEILNRTHFVLNIFFSGPTDELSIRFFVAAANGAVVLTEPGANKYPFVPGKHLVQCPIEEMPDQIEYYVKHPEEWRSISNNMLSLIQNELTLDRSVATILQQAEQHRQRFPA
jgi:hypothetical protein